MIMLAVVSLNTFPYFAWEYLLAVLRLAEGHCVSLPSVTFVLDIPYH